MENERAVYVQSPVNKDNAVEKKLSPSRRLQNQYKDGMNSELDLIESSKDKKKRRSIPKSDRQLRSKNARIWLNFM